MVDCYDWLKESEILLPLPVFMSVTFAEISSGLSLIWSLVKSTGMQLGVPGTNQLLDKSIAVSMSGDWEGTKLMMNLWSGHVIYYEQRFCCYKFYTIMN